MKKVNLFLTVAGAFGCGCINRLCRRRKKRGADGSCGKRKYKRDHYNNRPEAGRRT